MGIDDAKVYCNANSDCQGFSFAGPDERPDDEVTIMFKTGNKILHDVNWVSYVKETSIFGMMHGSADTSTGIVQTLTFELACVLLAIIVLLRVMYKLTRRKDTTPRHA